MKNIYEPEHKPQLLLDDEAGVVPHHVLVVARGHCLSIKENRLMRRVSGTGPLG